MNAENWNYELELQVADTQTRTTHLEERYFVTFPEAVTSLLELDFRLFDPEVADGKGMKHFYEAVSLVKTNGHEVELEVMQIPISEASNRGPSAGIYLQYLDGMVRDFEAVLGISLTNFSQYDPLLPVLQVASYQYNQELLIVPDPALASVLLQLQGSMPEQDQFQLHARQMDALGTSTQVFNYDNLSSALKDFIEHPFLDERGMAVSIGQTDPLMSLTIRNRNQEVIASVESVDPEATDAGWLHPGLYFEFPQGVKEFEQKTGLNFSSFPNYQQSSTLLLIAKADNDSDKVIPVEEFIQLKQSIHLPSQSATNGFTLQLHNYHYVHPGSAPHLPRESYETFQYASLEDAFKGLYELNPGLFDRMEFVSQQKEKYIDQASIIDNRDQTEIASKFMVKRGHEYLPEGVYVKVNQDILSLDILRSMSPFLNSLHHSGDFHFLFSKRREVEPQPAERKYSDSDRTFLPPGVGGRSL